MRKTENWIHKWGLHLAMLTMLGIIVWGGKEFISDMKIFQKEQIEINTELKKSNAILQERCINIDSKIATNSDVNYDQGVTLMDHGEQLVKHET